MPNRKECSERNREEVDTFDTMLSALVELLEEKGVLTQQEWENRIKEKIEKNQKLTSYRDIQFYDGTYKFKEEKNSNKVQYPNIAFLEDKAKLVPAYPPIDFEQREKARRLRVAIETAKAKPKKRTKSKPSGYHAWDWLKITREEMEEKSRQVGKNKCIICGRDSTKERSSILCQWHYAAFTKWRKRVAPSYP